MNSNDREKLERWIDAYVDDRLAPDQRARFEKLMKSSPSVRASVDLQRNIDLSLRRLFVPPVVEAANPADIGSSNGSPAHRDTLKRPLISRGVLGFAIAATIAVAAIGGWYAWTLMNPDLGDQGPIIRRFTLAQAYRAAEESDFKAQWLCKDDKEFAQTFYWRLGQALAMAAPPANIVPTGISYIGLERSKTPQSVEVIARVDGKGVIVFVDSTCKTAGPDEVGPGLYVHTRQLGKLTLCEVSPFDRPVMLDLLAERDIPDDWKRAPSYGGPRKNPPNNGRDRLPAPTSAPADNGKPSKWQPAKP